MKITVLKFDTHKAALTVASVFAVSTLLFLIPFMLIMPIAMQGANEVNGGGVAVLTEMFSVMIFMPVFYFIFAYLGVRFCAWFYNKIAGKTGGFVLTVAVENDD
jgi:hypothetical protein